MEEKDNRITGATSVSPCPHCGDQWFVVVQTYKTYWIVQCKKCEKLHIHMIDKTIVPNVDPIRGYE